MIIYIAGPISGEFDFMKKFAKAERYLKRQGHIVINPAKLTHGLKDYMPTCKALIDQADGVYFLKNWKKSKGSCEEHGYSLIKNKPTFYETSSKDEVKEARLYAGNGICVERIYPDEA